jgi:hypothetical protein
MDLKQFITTALTDVLEGINAAKEKYKNQVEPAQPSSGLGHGAEQRTATVSFDLNIKEAGPGQRVVLDSNNVGSNRLKFEVKVTF